MAKVGDFAELLRVLRLKISRALRLKLKQLARVVYDAVWICCAQAWRDAALIHVFYQRLQMLLLLP